MDQSGQAQTARGSLELISLVVAPTTLVTALAYYFGWVSTNARAAYFGIDPSLLGYSTQDYVLRSANAIFGLLIGAVGLFVVLVWLHAATARRVADRSHRAAMRVAARTVVVIGGVVLALGVLAVGDQGFSPGYLFPSAAPALGIAVIAYGLALAAAIKDAEQSNATGQHRRSLAAATPLVALLIVLCAFLSTAKYAEHQGRAAAKKVGDHLNQQAEVMIYTPQRLDLHGGGVVERRVTRQDSAYRFRYSGLRLLIHSAAKYFLLPEGWRQGADAAIVLQDRPEYRFAFVAANARVTAAANNASRALPVPVTQCPGGCRP